MPDGFAELTTEEMAAEAIREMASRLIHQPNSGYEEVKALERVALGAVRELAIAEAIAEEWERRYDQSVLGHVSANETSVTLAAEVARLEESFHAAVKLLNEGQQSRWDAEAEAARLREALEELRGVLPENVCADCAGFEHEVAEANRILDAALAGGDSDKEDA